RKKRRDRGEWVNGGAEIVEETGKREFEGARGATGVRLGLGDGNADAAVRARPPGCGCASKTSTCTTRCARVMAAARPLGPAPMMQARRCGGFEFMNGLYLLRFLSGREVGWAFHGDWCA